MKETSSQKAKKVPPPESHPATFRAPSDKPHGYDSSCDAIISPTDPSEDHSLHLEDNEAQGGHYSLPGRRAIRTRHRTGKISA